MKTGTFQSFFGFQNYLTTCFPSNPSDLVKGIAVNPNSILVGMSYHKPQDQINYTDKKQLTDTKSQLTIGYREWSDPAKATIYRVLDCLYGYVANDTSALILIK
jgi:hypothetical protein